MNVSELRFDDYCKALGYRCEPIPTRATRTADRRVWASGYELVVEIKELTPNADDRKQIAQIRSGHQATSGGRPGQRVYNEIKAAAGQLGRYRNEGLPTVLVLYDNVDRLSFPNDLLDPAFMDFGMYGLQSVTLALPSHQIVGTRRAGRRQMTLDRRLYISAVCVLNDQPLAVWVYHNYFAKERLPLSVFNGPYDAHLVKPGDPDVSPQDWQRIWPDA